MASRRLQTSVSGTVLEYLEDIGRTATAAPESWAGRGLRQILDEHLDTLGGRFEHWRLERREVKDFGDD